MKKSTFHVWLRAARPQTLTASIVPILVGASIAWSDQLFRWDATLVALFCAFAIQIGTNFANDYYDFIKGADTPDRIGFERATSAGLVSPKSMLIATFTTMGIAFLAGLYLVWIGGWIVLLIGVLSLLFGILYTGGPYPLGYNGLGDLFVFIFFGIIAVTGTYYVNALEWSLISLIAAIPVGALCVNILVVNNLRDIEQDIDAGKKTIGVLFGELALKIEYLAMLLISFSTPIILYIFQPFTFWIFLPFISIPVAWKLLNEIWNHKDKKILNNTLEQTAKYMLMFGILLSIGLII